MAAPRRSQLKKAKPGPRDSGARPGKKRSSGKKPSGTNLSRGGGNGRKDQWRARRKIEGKEQSREQRLRSLARC